MAFKSTHQRMTLGPAGSKVHDGYFSDSIRASDEIWVGGQVAQSDAGEVMAPGDIREQARIVFQRLRDVLALSDASLDDIVKMNLFFTANGEDVKEELHAAMAIWEEMAPNAHPAMTPVRAYELSQPGLLIQADCIAMTSI